MDGGTIANSDDMI